MFFFFLQEASAKVAAADALRSLQEDQDKGEIADLLFDMKHSMSHGKKYEAPPRSDMPPLAMHDYEYEVRHNTVHNVYDMIELFCFFCFFLVTLEYTVLYQVEL